MTSQTSQAGAYHATREEESGLGSRRLLVMGIGNSLLTDDAVGPLVVQLLERDPRSARLGLQLVDGGTLGLSLLPDIENSRAFIAVDAARFGAVPGTPRVFEGEQMDAQVIGRKQTAHEVALADLMGAAALQGLLPERRALVAVQPASTELGLEPSPEVRAALPGLVESVLALAERWSDAALPVAGEELA